MGGGIPFQQVEYLESTGTQYIDIGIIPDANTGISIGACTLTADDTYFCGQRNDANLTRWGIGTFSQSNLLKLYYGYNAGSLNYTITGGNALVDCLLNYKDNKTFFCELLSSPVALTSLAFTPLNSIAIFTNNGYISPDLLWSGRIYYAKVTQGSEIIMDLIPVRVGQVGYLYDIISGNLYGNKGTGDFIIGQDISTQIEQVNLPSEYKRLLYIDNIKGSYINTGVKVNDIAENPIIQTKYQQRNEGDIDWFGTNNNKGKIIFNFQNSSNSAAYIRWGTTSSSNLTWNSGFGNSSLVFTSTPKTLKLYGVNKLSIDIDGVNVANSGNYSTDFNTAYDIMIGAGRTANSSSRWYSFIISNGETEKFNGIPAIRKSDGEVGMFDIVTNTFFANVGAGQFIAGTEIF